MAYLDMDQMDAIEGLCYTVGLAAQANGFSGDYTEEEFSTRGTLNVGFYVLRGRCDAFNSLNSDHVFVEVPMLQKMGEILEMARVYLKPVATQPDLPS